MNLTNYGNVEETVNISINGTIPEGWITELSTKQIILAPEYWKIFSFIVTAPKTADENQTVNFTLDLKAETRNYTVSLSATVLEEVVNETNGDNGILKGKSYLWIFIGLIILIAIVNFYFIWMKRRKGKKEKLV